MSTDDEYKTILNLFRLGENVIKRGCTECQRQPNKVICLGEEQAFLLRLLFTDNQQWDIQGRKIHILDEELQNISLRCSERPEGIPVLWNQELGKTGEAKTNEDTEITEEEEIKRYIHSQCGSFRHWNKICEPILYVLAINSCNNVVDRDTLIHLCMNSKYGAVLFRKVIMKMLNLLVANWFDIQKLEEIAKFLSDFLKELSDYEYPSDLEQNVIARSNRICDRIKGSDIDMLYKEMRPWNREQHKRWVNGGDILRYFADLEHIERIYYASRLELIQRILVRKNLKEELWLPYNLIQLDGENEGTNYTQKIREVIDSLDAQDECRQKEAVKQLSEMFDVCVMDWIDEEVTSVHKWVIGKHSNFNC